MLCVPMLPGIQVSREEDKADPEGGTDHSQHHKSQENLLVVTTLITVLILYLTYVQPFYTCFNLSRNILSDQHHSLSALL